MGRPAALIGCVVALASMPARADITAHVPAEVAGDGRTSVPVVVNGMPDGAGKALPVIEVPAVSCTNALTLAAVGNALPGVLVPAVTASTTLACEARIRDSRTSFDVKLRPPPPGLYASVTQAARTTDGSATVSTFVWDGKRRSVPSWLHAAASDGTVTINKGGTLTLGLTGKAPRTIAIALIDGARAGAAFVPVTGSTLLPVESEAGSEVQVWVAGTWYGPVATEGKIAQVPIDVPAGVTHGVARSTDKKGYVTDAIVDLQIPARPRIAIAAATPSIGAGEAMMLAVAVASRDSRPAAPNTTLVPTAERGTVVLGRSLGGGLWTLRYTAPATQGPDKIRVAISGDERAGIGELALDVRGIAAAIELDVPTELEAGAELTGRVRVLDANRAVLREPGISATLGGEPVEVIAGDPLTLHAIVPTTVAAGVIPLEVVSGPTRARVDIAIRDTRPTTAELGVTQPAPVDTSIDRRRETTVGAWIQGGWLDNLGAWSTPRASLGAVVSRPLGGVDAALLVGVEGMTASDSLVVDVGGTPQTATRDISGIAASIGVRLRRDLGTRFGASLGAAVVPGRIAVAFGPMDQATEYTATVLGVRGTLAGDAAVGPGHVVVGVAFGRARLADGPVTGQVDGLGVHVGYEWWFGAIAR